MDVLASAALMKGIDELVDAAVGSITAGFDMLNLPLPSNQELKIVQGTRAENVEGTTSRRGKIQLTIGPNVTAARVEVVAGHEALHAIRNSGRLARWHRVGPTCVEEGLAMHFEQWFLPPMPTAGSPSYLLLVPEAYLTADGIRAAAARVVRLRRTLPPPLGQRAFRALSADGPMPEVLYATGFAAVCALRKPEDPIDPEIFLRSNGELMTAIAARAT